MYIENERSDSNVNAETKENRNRYLIKSNSVRHNMATAPNL